MRLSTWARDYVQYLRERRYVLEVGPLVVMTKKDRASGEMNAFRIGRDVERAYPSEPDPAPEPTRHLRVV